jgi:MFS family permease
MIMAYFVSYGVAGLMLFPLPDRWGSKKTMSIFGSVHVLSQFLILLIPDYTVRLVSFGIMGLCQLKNSTSYVWLFGLIRKKDTSISCGILNSWDSTTLFLLSLYFLHVDKSWYGIFLGMTILGLVALLFMILVSPENPKWLLAKGKREEAINAFNKIAKINGSKNKIEKDAVFIEFEDCEEKGNMTVVEELSRLLETEYEVPFAKSTNLTIILLVIASGQVFFVMYVSMFSITSVPGNTLFAGMTFGVAEGSSMLLSSYICTKVKDVSAFSFFCVLMMISQSVFYFVCGGESGGVLALSMIFCTVFAAGSNINIIYLMIEQRIPTEKLGSAIVVVITGSVFYTTFSA